MLGSRRRKTKEGQRSKSKSCGENEDVHMDKNINMEKPNSDGEWEIEFLEEDVEAREFFAGKTVNAKTPQWELKVAEIVAEFEHRELVGESTNQKEPRMAPMERTVELLDTEVGSNENEKGKPLGIGNVAHGIVLERTERTKVESSRKRLRITSEEDTEEVIQGKKKDDKHPMEEEGLPNTLNDIDKDNTNVEKEGLESIKDIENVEVFEGNGSLK
ncbi:uncharacterized protein LOC123987874 isoform X1 [Osmia bicornis bicornis]|uniref:uncharacterized protein LOC123987874 isoform X1 n=1 Tax=Osmia bicornis bicornis TaxID=1437191 RepID=UPI001EAF5C4D|nr:uncharacterized protein LOC123987874 isoform X1 [Osmia bicornis bicornis]